MVLSGMFCKTACSSVFHIFCTEIANLHEVTLGQDRKSQGHEGWLSYRTEDRAQTGKLSVHWAYKSLSELPDSST
jgi:hypothetical protein